MNFLQRLWRSNFSIRLRSWEYWPFELIHFPLFFYWGWLSLRARSLLFFTASNPGIPMGGMFGESKFSVLELVPSELKPITMLVSGRTSVELMLKKMQSAGLQFPVICKPDIGERGCRVERINSDADLRTYSESARGNFLIQELVTLPEEYAVFYVRHPKADHGMVSSVVFKKMLTVSGDGRSPLRELILRNDRAKLQWSRLKEKFASRLDEVVPAGVSIELVSIGNHSLGTTFIDATNLITPVLDKTFDRISNKIPGFFFGRYDLRCGSREGLYSGNIRIMELNGCGAEPAHIYQPGYSLWKATRVMFWHWREMYRISRENHRRGVNYTSLREGLRLYKVFRSMMK